MARALKIALWILPSLILLLALALFAATRLIDPNDFKPEISAMAEKKANLDLRIPGDLAWSFWPSLGVTIGRTESRIAGEKELFAAFENAHVSVSVWPLLFGQVQMDGIRLEGLNLNLVQTADGANWEAIGPTDGTAPSDPQPAAPKAKTASSPMTIPVSIPEVAVTDGQVRYRDSTSGTDIRVEQFNLNARNLSLDNSFPLAVSLRYQDQADIRVDLEADTIAGLDLENNIYRLNSLALKADIGGLTTNPVNLTLSQDLEARLDEERLKVRNLEVRAAGTHTRGQLDVTQWSTEPVIAGELHTDPFDANAALEMVGMSPIETSDPIALSAISLDATLSGPANSVIVDPLVVGLDNSELRGRAGLADLASGKLVADLTLDSIVLDGYLPPATEETASPGTPAAPAAGGAKATLSEEPLLPLETLRSLLADARLQIGSLQYENLSASDMVFAMTAEEGVLSLQEGTGKALNGSFDVSARLDASSDTPTWSLTQSVNQMQIQPAVKLALEKDLLKGLLSMNADLNASGNSEKALMESARGTASLDLVEGTLRGVNFHNTLMGGINDMLGAYQTLTTLLPQGDSGKLPRELSEDTHIVDLHAESHLENQVAYIDSLNAELRKGTLSGKGWLNVDNQQFDFTLGMKSPEFSDNKYFAGRTWPLRCEGELSGSPGDWCRPDRQGFRQMGKDIAAQATKEKVKEKLGVDAEGDTAEEVMKNAAEEKAKEEVKKKVEEKLKSLFN